MIDGTLVTSLVGELAGSEVQTISELYASSPGGYCNRAFADQTYTLEPGDKKVRTLNVDFSLYNGQPPSRFTEASALTATDEARRQFDFLSRSRELAPAEGDLRSIGEEVAVGYDDPEEDEPAAGEVVLRRSNLVVHVTFGGTDAAAEQAEVPMSPDAAVDGARRLARSIAENLQQ